jgi:hypothetical protein
MPALGDLPRRLPRAAAQLHLPNRRLAGVMELRRVASVLGWTTSATGGYAPSIPDLRSSAPSSRGSARSQTPAPARRRVGAASLRRVSAEGGPFPVSRSSNARATGSTGCRRSSSSPVVRSPCRAHRTRAWPFVHRWSRSSPGHGKIARRPTALATPCCPSATVLAVKRSMRAMVVCLARWR